MNVHHLPCIVPTRVIEANFWGQILQVEKPCEVFPLRSEVDLVREVDVVEHEPGGREEDHEQVVHRQHLPKTQGV